MLKTIIYTNLFPSEYFAIRVHDAIKGLGTNDNLLIRVLVTRNEIDMPKIKQYYKFGGVRIEDDILITEDGCVNLTEGLPRTVEDIEKTMKSE